MKYAIPLLFVAGAAFAQAPPNQPQPPPPPAQAQPAQSPQATAPNAAARNAAIQRIEQALQDLKSNNQ